MKTTILVVDDQPANLLLLEYVLQARGYHVETAADAMAALEAIELAVPQLILMDLQLPGMDGFELTRRLKASPATAHIPIVAVTSYAMCGDGDRARAAGCDGYVTKPIDTRTFPEIVASYLRRESLDEA